MTIPQEEIFGPVLVVIAYDSEDEAIRIANDSEYGLHAAVLGTDLPRARRIASQIRSGRVVIFRGRPRIWPLRDRSVSRATSDP